MSFRPFLPALVLIAVIVAMVPFAASAQQPAAPNIAFLGNGQNITVGDATPSVADGTDFGTTIQGLAVTHFFVVRNTGNANLVVDAISAPAGFDYVTQAATSLPITVPPSGAFFLQVSCLGKDVAEISDFVTFTSNDPVNGRASFQVHCKIDGAPEVDVSGNSTRVEDGSTTPASANATEFGSVPVGSPITHTFRVSNRGRGDLTVGAVTVPAGFTVLNPLPALIPSGGGADLEVRCNATSENTYAGDVSIANSDLDENPFNFRIHCVVGDGQPDFNPGQDDLPPATATVTNPVVVVTPPPSNPNRGGNQGGGTSNPSPAPTVAGGGSVINQAPTAPVPTATATVRPAATAAPTTPPASQGIFRPPATGDAGLTADDGVAPAWLEVAAAATLVAAIALAAVRIRARS